MDPVTLAALISAGGGILGSAMSRGDIARQNAYNNPVRQVARMNAAGLPMAALNEQTAGNQSALPEVPNFGEISKHIVTSPQKKQMQLIDEQIALLKDQQNTEKARGAREWVNSFRDQMNSGLEHEQYKIRMNAEGGYAVPDGLPPSNVQREYARGQRMQDVAETIQGIEKATKGLERDIKGHEKGRQYLITEEVRNRTYNLILQSGLFENQLQAQKANMKLIEGMEKNGMSPAEAFFHVLFTGGYDFNILPNIK